ncbi:MAG: type II toxin-antitoxin system mRNA interferase toxin, RelE/StbE family [Nanoarchaeota archaeon]|nr:type II toxin-antitoxin system mRNA interferase toxin, RelE/StbE family [Nanoarchaeota archaeon]
MYEIILENPAKSFIRQLKKEDQVKLLDAINELGINPRFGKELVGRLSGLRSRRISNYRIIYRIEEMKVMVFVVKVGYRKNIYSQKMNK